MMMAKDKQQAIDEAAKSALENMHSSDDYEHEEERATNVAQLRQSPPPATNSTMTGAVAIATQTKAHVEAVTEFIMRSIGEIRAELDEMERVAMDDCERLKTELDGHVVSAQAMVQQVEGLKRLTGDIKAKRATLLNPRRQ